MENLTDLRTRRKPQCYDSQNYVVNINFWLFILV